MTIEKCNIWNAFSKIKNLRIPQDELTAKINGLKQDPFFQMDKLPTDKKGVIEHIAHFFEVVPTPTKGVEFVKIPPAMVYHGVTQHDRDIINGECQTGIMPSIHHEIGHAIMIGIIAHDFSIIDEIVVNGPKKYTAAEEFYTLKNLNSEKYILARLAGGIFEHMCHKSEVSYQYTLLGMYSDIVDIQQYCLLNAPHYPTEKTLEKAIRKIERKLKPYVRDKNIDKLAAIIEKNGCVKRPQIATYIKPKTIFQRLFSCVK